MRKIQEDIIKLLREIQDIETVKIIYHFIRGIISGRK